MKKWTSILAIPSLILFFLLFMNYEKENVVELDENMDQLFGGNTFIGFFHYFGETKLIITIALIMMIVLWLKHRNYRGMFFVLLTIAGGNALNQWVKRLVERPRPEIVDQFSTYSFPSGHAMVGLLYLFTIAYLLSEQMKNHQGALIVWCIIIIITLLVGLSRIAESRHYGSDVIAGWALGYSWFILGVLVYEQSKKFYKKLRKHEVSQKSIE